jgi:hypothetical protein
MAVLVVVGRAIGQHGAVDDLHGQDDAGCGVAGRGHGAAAGAVLHARCVGDLWLGGAKRGARVLRGGSDIVGEVVEVLQATAAG